ncbi:hypothetical protein K7X08_032233 [Anisodus acutangulus]|uniref:Uncharacterized protein n=1 Tax=Anisodus acutangulus TaxID=402998 RepID=A0A9Q1MC44_9SOLA|nr:hypothetical protein K7X08_032233 [Anisodus acutangulus]
MTQFMMFLQPMDKKGTLLVIRLITKIQMVFGLESENDFFPTYNEDLRLVEASYSEVDLENLDEYIFKVWEFDIPDEEDELVKQFNKALAGSSPDSTSSASENLGVVLDDKLLDDIISGLDDLSLSPSNN